MRIINTKNGFTIVELLIVIVVIGILGAITLVGYNGIIDRAREASAQTAAKQAYTKVVTYATTSGDVYPASLAAAGVSNSGDTTFEYSVNNSVMPRTFCVTATVSNKSYYVSHTTGSPISGTCVGHVGGGPVVWSQVAAGENHTIALASDGKLYAWGSNYVNQLGDGTDVDRESPDLVDMSGVLEGKTITQIVAGAEHNLVLASDGTVYGWGTNFAGHLGDGSTTDRATPVAVNMSGVLAGKTITQIAAGYSFSLALASDGTLYSWGSNSGELGDGTTTDRSNPVAVNMSGVLSGKTITQIGAGGQHAIALASDGTVYSWGRNTYGQLGDGTTTTRLSPVAVSTSGVLSGKTVSGISAYNSYHSMVFTTEGLAYAWGRNDNSQIGDNSSTNRTSPVAVNAAGVLSGETIASVTALNGHSFAAASDSTAYTWGGNFNGELFDGTTTDRAVPVAVSMAGALSGKTITQITGQSGFSLVLTSDGSLYAAGYNGEGQLGDGTTTDRDDPVVISIP
jgi:prepilin-type N-terminal cleavage/methylation domain-containing protein